MRWPDLDELLAIQHECVASWQLVDRGWTKDQIAWRLPRAGLREVTRLDGVWTSTRGDLTQRQRWSAATRTAPDTGLGLSSAARYWDMVDNRRPEGIVIVFRRGAWGRRLHGDVLVCRVPDLVLEDRDGIPVVPAARTVVDLTPYATDEELRRIVIEAIRLKLTTVDELRSLLPRRRGAPRLRALLDHIEDLPIARCRSNAEGTALVRRKDAGSRIPEVNVMVAGYLADQVDFERREITEIDGPGFHADTERDAERDRAQRAAGFTVTRRPSDDAYDPRAGW